MNNKIPDWSEALSVGHEKIDSQHKMFLGLLRDFEATCAGEHDKQAIVGLLSEIMYFTKFHFLCEKNIMNDIDYPLVGEHRNQHALLIEALGHKIYQYKTGECDSDELNDFILDWFMKHTVEHDKKLVEFLAK